MPPARVRPAALAAMAAACLPACGAGGAGSDPVGAANVSATLVGTIDIADTDWLTFTVANFT